MGALLRAAHEMQHEGTFGFAADAASPRDIDKAFPEQGAIERDSKPAR